MLNQLEFDWNGFWDEISTNPCFWVIVAAVALLVVFLFKLRRRPKVIELFSSSAGQVQASRTAIIELIQRICREKGGVTSPARIKVSQGGGKLKVKVKLKYYAEDNIEKQSVELQNSISKTLQENLGIENVGPVDIVVTGFLKKVDE